MKHLSAYIVSMVVLGLSACGSPTPGELASLAAKGYYAHLLAGEYEYFLDGRVGADEMPEAYRQQLMDAYAQFMARQDSIHHGIREVRVVNARTDTLLQSAQVYMVLCFGDSTNEEVVVPMVERDGRWMMK